MTLKIFLLDIILSYFFPADFFCMPACMPFLGSHFACSHYIYAIFLIYIFFFLSFFFCMSQHDIQYTFCCFNFSSFGWCMIISMLLPLHSLFVLNSNLTKWTF